MATPLPAHRRQTISRRSGVKSSGEVLAEGADRSRQTTDSAKLDAYRFAEFDADGDKKLDFEEFLAFLPKRIRDVYTPRDIRAWFDAADTNGDGTLSTNEFFRFSLSSSALRWGANPIKSILRSLIATSQVSSTVTSSARWPLRWDSAPVPTRGSNPVLREPPPLPTSIRPLAGFCPDCPMAAHTTVRDWRPRSPSERTFSTVSARRVRIRVASRA